MEKAKKLAHEEFEHFTKLTNDVTHDTEKDFEDPLNPKARKLDEMLHRRDINELGYKEVDRADRVIDRRGVDVMEEVQNYDTYNKSHDRYEGVNLAEQSPIRIHKAQVQHDPLLHGISERMHSQKKNRDHEIERKRRELQMTSDRDDIELEVPRDEVTVAPEDTYFDKSDMNIAPDIETVNPY